MPITAHTHTATMCASHAICEVWVTPLPMFSCHGFGPADCAHAPAAGNSLAATAHPDFTAPPHLLLCFMPGPLTSSVAAIAGREQAFKCHRKFPAFDGREETPHFDPPATGN